VSRVISTSAELTPYGFVSQVAVDTFQREAPSPARTPGSDGRVLLREAIMHRATRAKQGHAKHSAVVSIPTPLRVSVSVSVPAAASCTAPHAPSRGTRNTPPW
jgi:hypothetical protein